MNLIGFIVRGFFWKAPPIDASSDHGLQELLDNESHRLTIANTAVTAVSIAVAIGYLGIVTYFWNYRLTLAAGMIMIGRLPDLLWEIKTGQKVTRSNAPQSILGYAGIILAFVALPVVWYALC